MVIIDIWRAQMIQMATNENPCPYMRYKIGEISVIAAELDTESEYGKKKTAGGNPRGRFISRMFL